MRWPGLKKHWRRITLFMLLGAAAIAASRLLFLVLPGLLALFWPKIVFSIPAQEKCAYLTIDDAPSSRTPEILATLKKHRVQATFFIITDRIASPGQIAQILESGHRLGHHMKTGQAIREMNMAEFRDDFDDAAEALAHFGGTRWFRPASGIINAQQLAHAEDRDFKTVLGTAYAMDHAIRNPELVRRLASWMICDDGIVILHDGEEHAQGTAEVLDRLIPELKARGYHLQPLPE